MADKTSGGPYKGHDEGTVPPPNAPYVKSPATYVPLSQSADGVNSKTPMGNSGKAS